MHLLISLEVERCCNLTDTRIGGFENLPKGRVIDVSVDRAIGIELRVIEDVEHLQSQFQKLCFMS